MLRKISKLALALLLAFSTLALAQSSLTLQSAATTGNGIAMTTSGYSAVALAIIGSAGADRIVTFNASQDGTHYSTMMCYNVSTLAQSTTITASGTTLFQFRCNITGIRSIQAPVSGGSTGNVTVTALALQNVSVIYPSTIAPVIDKGGQVYNAKAYGLTGDGTTDDGTALQALCATVKTAHGVMYFPAGTYLTSLGCNLDDSTSVTWAGPDNPTAGAAPQAVITYTGTGTFLSVRSSIGFRLSNLYITGASLAATKMLLDFSHSGGLGTDASFGLVERSYLSGSTTAAAVIGLDDAIEITIQDNHIVGAGATAGVQGIATAGHYSNSIHILRNQFKDAVHAITNADQAWVIQGNTFEGTGAFFVDAYSEAGIIAGNGVVWDGNWFGDSGAGTHWINWGGGAVSVTNNYFGTGTDAVLTVGSTIGPLTLIGNNISATNGITIAGTATRVTYAGNYGTAGVVGTPGAGSYVQTTTNTLYGNVTMPGGILDVKATADGVNAVLVRRSNNTTIGYLFPDGSGNGLLGLGPAAGGTAIQLSASGNSYLNGGNVGVNDNNPGFKLSVVGTGHWSGLTAASGTPNSLCLNAATKEITEDASTSCLVSARDQKDAIEPLELSGIATVLRLAPRNFVYRDALERQRWGFVADEVQAVDFHLGDAYTKGEARSIDIPAMLAILTKAIQEQQEQIATLARSH